MFEPHKIWYTEFIYINEGESNKMSIEILLGTYTRRESEGIYRINLNPETKNFGALELVANVGSPTYLTTDDQKEIIYSVISGDDQGGLVSLVKQDNGEYKKKDEVVGEGAAPCYVAYDGTRQFVYTANYHNGSISVYKTDADGNLELVDTVVHEGSSVHENQDAPHAHYSDLTPDKKYLLSCDLGTDEVYTYDINDEGKLTEVARLEVKAGTGPRHLVFHPTLDVAYLFGELSSEVLILDYNSETGEFTLAQTLPTIPEDHTSFNGGAAIRISADGKFVYASNRGHDSLAIFSTNEKGRLEFVAHTPTEGEIPRDFDIDPSGKFIVVGHQDSDNLTVFERNQNNGMLTLIHKNVHAPEVVCVSFI